MRLIQIWWIINIYTLLYKTSGGHNSSKASLSPIVLISKTFIFLKFVMIQLLTQVCLVLTVFSLDIAGTVIITFHARLRVEKNSFYV